MYKVMNCIERAPAYFDDAESALIFAYAFNYPGQFTSYIDGLEKLKKHYNIALKLFNDLDNYSVIHINGAAICECENENGAPVLPGENAPPALINPAIFTNTPENGTAAKTAKTGPKTSIINSTITINNKGQIII